MSLDKDLVETLRKSRANPLVGELYPILEAADGELIDGLHREEAGWQTRSRLPNIVTRLDKLVARAMAHQRRTMSASERRKLYDGIAEELIEMGLVESEHLAFRPKDLQDRPKVIPKIAELLGVTERYVASYISDKYKRGVYLREGEGRKKRGFKRSTFEIRANILEILAKETLRPTPLMYRANLSWNPIKINLDFLYQKGLIEIDSQRYSLTDLGHKILRQYLELKSWLL